MGAFGLVWYVETPAQPEKHGIDVKGQLSKGSAHWTGRGREEDYEAILDSRPVQANVP